MEKELISLFSEAVFSTPQSISSFGALLLCTFSILVGGVVAIFGSAFILMAAAFGLAAFRNFATFDKIAVLLSLGGMIALELTLIWGSFKGAMNYCPAIMSSGNEATE